MTGDPLGLDDLDVDSGPQKVWEAQEGSQRSFLSCPIFECLYEGTRGPGKSDALIMDFAQHCEVGWGPDWRGVIFRQTYQQLDDINKKCEKWFRLMFPGATYNKSDHTWTWPTGEQLLLRRMVRDEDYYDFHGHAYPFIGWDELCTWATPSMFKLMLSCCRSTVARDKLDKFGRPLPRKVRATANPYGPGHNWVKKRYRLPHMRGIVIRDSMTDDGRPEPPRIALHGSLKENKLMLAAEPDYENTIAAAARNPAELKAWIEGSWDVTSGGMFDDLWDSKVHVVRPFAIPSHWFMDRSFDWGGSRPASVGWWAESDGSDYMDGNGRRRSSVRGDLFRVKEWYVADTRKDNTGLQLTPSQLSEGILRREIAAGWIGHSNERRVRPGPADTKIWNPEDPSAESIAKAMEKALRIDNRMMAGVKWTEAIKDRKLGWQACRERLQGSIPKIGGAREKPGLFVYEDCNAFINTVPSIPRDGKDPDDVDTDVEDHPADDTRYRVMKVRRQLTQGRTRGAH